MLLKPSFKTLQPFQMQGQEQENQLKRMRLVATSLLLVMVVLFIVTRALEAHHPALGFVSSFAEAATVGALADWFAVTALFRSPLGLPIPHTAIIPRNKDRIGEGLSDFLEHNFLTREVLQEEVGAIDFAGVAARWLADPANSGTVSRQIAHGIPSVLRLLEDEDVRQYLQRHLGAALERIKPGPALADILAMLVANRYHQQAFTRLIEAAAHLFENHQPYLRLKIHENSPRWMPRAIDEKIYERLLDGIQEILDEMRGEESEWRLRFQEWVDALIERLRTSPEYEARIAAFIQDVTRQPLFHVYTADLWNSARTRLIADAVADDSRTAALLEEALRSLAEGLLHDARLQTKMNEWIRGFITEFIFTKREFIADLVSRVIRTWDAQTVSRRVEQFVGKDLQYIRINGTLVGGLVGLLLHAVSLALTGAT